MFHAYHHRQFPLTAHVFIPAEYQDNLVDTRYATSLVTFSSFIGRMIALGIGGALFTNVVRREFVHIYLRLNLASSIAGQEYPEICT
jgi:hypothetical protein